MKWFKKSLAASSLVTGAAVLTLALPATAYAWGVGGHSASGCSEASGDYNYEKVGMYGGSPGYRTWGDLTVSKTCSYGVALQTKFDSYYFGPAGNGDWVTGGWKTIRNSTGTVDITEDDPPVRNVRFQICDVINGSLRYCAPVK
ncbi:hypothetical protein ACWCV5_13315 [Streptomyces tubercidicus]